MEFKAYLIQLAADSVLFDHRSGEKKSSPPSDGDMMYRHCGIPSLFVTDEEEKTPSTALRDCILNWLEKQSAADMHKLVHRMLQFPKLF